MRRSRSDKNAISQAARVAPKVRILVADNYARVRKKVSRVLAARPEWVVCGEAVNGRQAVALAGELRPDVVVLDFALPELNGLEAARQIRATLPQTEVLILTDFDSEHLIREALAAGVRGFVAKRKAGPTLLTAVEHLSQHRPFYPSRIAPWTQAEGRPAQERPTAGDLLTARERAVLQLIAEGQSVTAAAEALGLSDEAVERHGADLMGKLKVGSISELVHYAICHQMVPR